MRLPKNSLEYLLLTAVILTGVFIFTYQISTIPSGVYVDEAVVGYDAYSILHTFRDHYGQLFPVYFRFFDSYTPGLFVYVVALAERFLGLDTLAIRLPSAISMLLVGLSLFRFLKKHQIQQYKYSPIITTLLFFITPWTVFNARLGYETTFAFALFSIGVLTLDHPFLSLFLISLSSYAGHTQRYLAPIFVLLVIWIHFKKNGSIKKIIRPLLLAAIIQIPNLVLMFTPSFWVKSSSLSLSFFEHYLSYFSPLNLFSRSDFDVQRSIPQLSVLYSWMFIPLILGLYSMYINRHRKLTQYVLALLLIAPIPAALGNTNFSTQRALPMLLPLSIIIGLGMDLILHKMSNPIRIGSVVILLAVSGILLWRSYFVLFPVQRAVAWNYGYSQLAKEITDRPDSRFIVDDSRGVPYILILYWLRYPPDRFQQQNQVSGDYYRNPTTSSPVTFGNVEVRGIVWKQDLCTKQILVGDKLSISTDQVAEHYLVPVFIIQDFQDNTILQAYETNPVKKCIN